MTVSAAKTATSEPDVAFPAVLKGSQKQRVPPPVPPRGSPKPKRGGANSQSTIDKGEYSINVSTSEIPAQTPITSSDDDFVFYGHDFKFKEPNVPACSLPPSISEHSVKLTKLTSNSFLDFAEEADSITERAYPGKDLIIQTNMMAKFNIDKTIREHLDSGEYNGSSFTESSSEERIVIEEVEMKDVDDTVLEDRARQTKSPSQFIRGVVNQIGEKFSLKSPTRSVEEKASVHNVKSSDLITAAKTLKKTSKSENIQKDLEREISEVKSEKSVSKPGIISGITKRLNSRKDKNGKDKGRSQEKKRKPKVEIPIKTYSEEHSKGMSKDEVVCHRKAKSKIDMFQKHILKVQSDSENSSRRSSLSSSQSSQKSSRIDLTKQVLVKETKKIFEPRESIRGSTSSNTLQVPQMRLPLTKSAGSNVHDKIRKFSEPTTSADAPNKIPRQKKRSFKKRSEKRKIYKMRKEIEEVLSNDTSVCWTPPASVEGSTPTWTEGTPSFTESSSSEQGYPMTPARGATPSDGRRSPRAPPPPARTLPPNTINCLTSEVVEVKHLTTQTSNIKITTYEVHQEELCIHEEK
ncbi:hypothetical protein NE865_04247 [Phthorimaea operculella]|nr:hypothetical protein NE865_04247 [Phthorimaea operculella]